MSAVVPQILCAFDLSRFRDKCFAAADSGQTQGRV